MIQRPFTCTLTSPYVMHLDPKDNRTTLHFFPLSPCIQWSSVLQLLIPRSLTHLMVECTQERFIDRKTAGCHYFGALFFFVSMFCTILTIPSALFSPYPQAVLINDFIGVGLGLTALNWEKDIAVL